MRPSHLLRAIILTITAPLPCLSNTPTPILQQQQYYLPSSTLPNIIKSEDYWANLPKSEYIKNWNGRSYHPFAGAVLGQIRQTIVLHKHKHWGLLLYRCDYSDDDLWSKFLAAVYHETDEALKATKQYDLAPSYAITVKEDKDTLDGASVDRIRDIFTHWVKSNAALAENGNDKSAPYSVPRYTYCVHVDFDVLDAVVNRAPRISVYTESRQAAYVNLVQVKREDFSEIFGDMGSQERDDCIADDGEDQCAGEEEDEGDEYFVRVPLRYIGPEGYHDLYNSYTFERWRQFRGDYGVSFG